MPLTPWPMYFAKLPLRARGLEVRVGDPFPVQSKPVIRGLASAYGYTDEQVAHLAFNELPFVEVRTVQDGLERALRDAQQAGTAKPAAARRKAATEAA